MAQDMSTIRAALNQLKREGARIQSAIAALEALFPVEGRADITLQDATVHATMITRTVSVADAAVAAIKEAPARAWAVQDLYDAVRERGATVASANIVGSILARRAKEKGDIMRVGRGLWALANPEFAGLALDPDTDDDPLADTK